jgi:hypothetical protein
LTVLLTSFFRVAGALPSSSSLSRRQFTGGWVGCVLEFGLLLNAFGQLSINNLDPGDAEGQSVAGHRVGLSISNSSSSWTGRGTKKKQT